MLLCFILLTFLPKIAISQEVVHYGAFDVNFVQPEAPIKKREADPTFRGHPKTKEEMWALAFQGGKLRYDQIPSLINLLQMIAMNYLSDCTPVILYDSVVENNDGLLLEQLMKTFPFAYVHGRISKENAITDVTILHAITTKCVSYILFLADVMKSADVLGLQATSKVIIIARSSQWRVQEFLYSKASRSFVNLLVVSQSFRDDDTVETPYILYTHSLFVDGLGASKPSVLTSWSKGKLARPEVNLFPQKMSQGYAGHRFTVVAANQPPFVFKKVYRDYLGNPKISWDGIEYRLINILGHRHNFSVEIKEPDNLAVGSGDAVWHEVSARRADMGIGGLYVTSDRLFNIDMSMSHSQDCAAFISLTSTALPRYRAIMGPFNWTVWLALTLTYLFGIFPLAFSDKHTLKHLIHNTGEVENMFWYVFGTFTNCFTFVGKNSWSRTTKVTTRLLIGWYWIFTIIITACYTGSIIAFVTLPVYPATVDNVDQLLSGHYRVGTLDRGGWERWFSNSSDERTNKLFKHLELVPDIEAGLRNTTKAFFWPYAFLGSKFQLEYVVQSNFTMDSLKRSILHISDKCFTPFGVSLAFPKESVYTEKLNIGILRMTQSGIVDKLISDVKWKMQRSSSGKLLQVSSGKSLRGVVGDKQGLSLGDTQGMFLLLGAGFLAAAAALLSEWLGGCGRMCRRQKRVSSSSSTTSIATVSSNIEKSHIAPTPISKTESKCELALIPDINNDSGIVKDLLNQENNESIEKFILNVNECNVNHTNQIDTLNDTNKIPDVQNLQVCADIVHNGKDTLKGHSRRSSYVDWDSEISDLFHYPKSELGSDDEHCNKPIASLEVIDDEDFNEKPTEVLDDDLNSVPENVEETLSNVFGEKVSPV